MVASAPAYQTTFSLAHAPTRDTRLYRPSHLATAHSVIVEAEEHDSDDSAPLVRSTSAPSLAAHALSTPSPSAQTRSRAMGNLTEALERRRAKENLNPQSAHIGLANPNRHNKKALGLQAAVGSYKMKKLARQFFPLFPSSSQPSPCPLLRLLAHLFRLI